MVSYEKLVAPFAIPETELQKKCSDDVLLKVSKTFTRWRSAVPYLGLEDTVVEELEGDCTNEEEKRQHVLKRWKGRFQFEATYEKLMKCSLKANRADLAQLVAQEIKKGGPAGVVALDSSTQEDGEEDLFASLDQLAGKEIFLSYTHTEDVEPFVMQLQKGLEERGFSVWLHKTDISLGLDLPIATETSLWLSKAVMAVITRKYIESKFCDMELCHAQIKGKEKLSILYEKIDFNGSDKARKLDMVISRNQHIHFQQGEDDFSTFVDKVVEVLKAKGLGAHQAH